MEGESAEDVGFASGVAIAAALAVVAVAMFVVSARGRQHQRRHVKIGAAASSTRAVPVAPSEAADSAGVVVSFEDDFKEFPRSCSTSSTQDSDVEMEELLEEVGKKSQVVLRIVTGTSAKKFCLPNLVKYLRSKGVKPLEGGTQEERIKINAQKLLALLNGAGVPQNSTPRWAASRLRHELIQQAISPIDLQMLLPRIKEAYAQQADAVGCGADSRGDDQIRTSCYLTVMENWKPQILPHEPMVECLGDVMRECARLFKDWHCSRQGLLTTEVSVTSAFVTAYRPSAEEDPVQKSMDDSDASMSAILSLPTDDPFDGGAVHVWDSKPEREFKYHMGPGDIIFLEGSVWHQVKPVSVGTRWTMVLSFRLSDVEQMPKA